MLEQLPRALDERRPYWHRWGFLRGSWARRQLKALKLGTPGTRVSIGVPGIPHRVWARAGTADQWVYEQIFLKNELQHELPFEPRWIVDAGANIGFATIWFAARYPQARITAMEIDHDNIEVLRLNTGPIGPRVTVLECGLWGHATRLAISNPDAETWSYLPVEARDGPISAVGVAELLAESGGDRIGLLKVDIEGSELEVLNSAESWIDRVDALMIELHDRKRPGCTEALQRVISLRKFRVTSQGDYHLLVREPA